MIMDLLPGGAAAFDKDEPLGAFLNELTDVVSDAALYLPFVLVAPLAPLTQTPHGI